MAEDDGVGEMTDKDTIHYSQVWRPELRGL